MSIDIFIPTAEQWGFQCQIFADVNKVIKEEEENEDE